MASYTSIFNGQFENGSQIKSVPQAVLAVEIMILYGSHIKNDGMIYSTSSHNITAFFFCKQFVSQLEAQWAARNNTESSFS